MHNGCTEFVGSGGLGQVWPVASSRPDQQSGLRAALPHVALSFWHDAAGGLKESDAMKFNVTVDRDEDGVWIVECPSIPGCVSQGASKDEALDNIAEAIKLCLEVRAERGLPLTIETRQIEVAA
jgi:predicted RNase H-like HicB family nuclease